MADQSTNADGNPKSNTEHRHDTLRRWSSLFMRPALFVLILVIATAGAFAGGYLLMAREGNRGMEMLRQQQAAAQDQIAALEQQLDELRSRPEHTNVIEVDLNAAFEPIRQAVGRVALAKAGAISRQIAAELNLAVEASLTEERGSSTQAALTSRPDGKDRLTGETALAETPSPPPAPATRTESVGDRVPDPASEVRGKDVADPPDAPDAAADEEALLRTTQPGAAEWLTPSSSLAAAPRSGAELLDEEPGSESPSQVVSPAAPPSESFIEPTAGGEDSPPLSGTLSVRPSGSEGTSPPRW